MGSLRLGLALAIIALGSACAVDEVEQPQEKGASLSTTYDDCIVTSVLDGSGLLEVTILSVDGDVLRSMDTFEDVGVDFTVGLDLAAVNEVVHLMWQDEQKVSSLAVDGCTGAPDGWWGGCCDIHDACYDSCAGRLGCDSGLYNCMVGVGAGQAIAGAYFAGVRLFGATHYCE